MTYIPQTTELEYLNNPGYQMIEGALINALIAAVNGENPLRVPAGSASLPSITTNTDLTTGIYLPGTDTVGFSFGGDTQVLLSSTTNAATLEATGDGAIVGLNCDTKGTTTVGYQFNGLINGVYDVGTSGRYFFNIQGSPVLVLTDTYWNPNALYTGQPEGYIVMSSGGVASGLGGDMISGVISVDSPEYDHVTTTGLTLMLGAKGSTGAVHFLGNGLVGHVSIAAPANAAGDDIYGNPNILWMRGSQRGHSQHPTIYTNGETDVGLQVYTGTGVGKTTFLGNNTLASLLELRPGSTTSIQGFYMQSSVTGSNPTLGVGTFNGYTPADTNLGMNITSRGTGLLRFFTGDATNLQVVISNSSSAANYINMTGAATGLQPSISSQGEGTNGLIIYCSGSGPLDLKTSNTAHTNLSLRSSGLVRFADSASWAANGANTVTITNVAPAGVATATIKKWLVIEDDGAGTIYVPAWGA